MGSSLTNYNRGFKDGTSCKLATDSDSIACDCGSVLVQSHKADTCQRMSRMEVNLREEETEVNTTFVFVLFLNLFLQNIVSHFVLFFASNTFRNTLVNLLFLSTVLIVFCSVHMFVLFTFYATYIYVLYMLICTLALRRHPTLLQPSDRRCPKMIKRTASALFCFYLASLLLHRPL